MSDDLMSSRLEQRWLPVLDERGRTHMEAVWILVSESAGPRVTHAA